MKRLRPIYLAGLALAATLGASHASATVVESFSFEAPSLSAGSYDYNPAGTPGVAYNGVSGPFGSGGSGIATNGSAFSFPAAPDGDQVAFIQNASDTVGQITLTLGGLTAGSSYDATFYTAARAGSPAYPANPLSVMFDSTVVGSSTGASTAFTLHTTNDFVATAGTDMLTFTGLASTATGGDVALDFVTIQSVPEPDVWSLMLVGFGAIGCVVRLRMAGRSAPEPLVGRRLRKTI